MKKTNLPSALLVFVLLISGCSAEAPLFPPAEPNITDANWLTSNYWNDGKAEIAFYQIERIRTRFGSSEEQSILAGTYLVKHDFDQERSAKANSESQNAVPAFKWAIFYEFESKAYQFKESWVTNATQENLRPLRSSFTSFDWCSNTYWEQDFRSNGDIAGLFRSDDYGNKSSDYRRPAGSYPMAELPLLIRGLDLANNAERNFSLILTNGTEVKVSARLRGTETLSLAGQDWGAEKIEVTYESEVPSLIGETADLKESYWRSVDPSHMLLKIESESGRYKMYLVEQLRSPYWQENFYPQLEYVKRRP